MKSFAIAGGTENGGWVYHSMQAKLPEQQSDCFLELIRNQGRHVDVEAVEDEQDQGGNHNDGRQKKLVCPAVLGHSLRAYKGLVGFIAGTYKTPE